LYILKVIDRTRQLSSKIFFLACNKAPHKLELLLLLTDNIAERRVRRGRCFTNSEVSVISVNEDKFHGPVAFCRLHRHLPAVVRDIERELHARVRERTRLCERSPGGKRANQG